MAFPNTYSLSSDSNRKKMGTYVKISLFWKFTKYSTQLQFHIRYGKIICKSSKQSIFHHYYVISYGTSGSRILPYMIMFILLRAFCSFGAKRWNQMLCGTRWPQSPAILRYFVWKYIFKIDWDIAIRIINFVCCLVPSNFNPWLPNCTGQRTRPRAMFPENFSAIGAVVTEIRHFEVSMVVSSAQHSVACLLTELLCLRVFTRIVLTAKRSHTRTPRLYQNVPWTFRNLFRPVWQPKNASFFRTCRGIRHFRLPTLPARVTL